jgi:hypothetical protein
MMQHQHQHQQQQALLRVMSAAMSAEAKQQKAF